jgi:hypothetical protein
VRGAWVCVGEDSLSFSNAVDRFRLIVRLKLHQLPRDCAVIDETISSDSLLIASGHFLLAFPLSVGQLTLLWHVNCSFFSAAVGFALPSPLLQS